MEKTIIRITAAGIVLFALNTASAQDVKRSITQVEGDVYRFQNQFHYSLVTVTNDGVVVVDPINAEAAGWLKENLSQITDQPITHLIYSHSHGDHASGGAALGATTIIAQENAPASIDGVEPTMRVGAEETIEVGGKTFELTFLGTGHGEDMLAVIVRPENVGFITDVASPKRLPFKTMSSSSVDAWIEQVKKVDTLDFEIFAPAHGNVGVKADTQDVITYMETLRAEVLAGLKEGKSVEQLQASIALEEYKDWGNFDEHRPLNIQGMAEYLIKANKVK